MFGHDKCNVNIYLQLHELVSIETMWPCGIVNIYPSLASPTHRKLAPHPTISNSTPKDSFLALSVFEFQYSNANSTVVKIIGDIDHNGAQSGLTGAAMLGR